jgi:hypothetical protein
MATFHQTPFVTYQGNHPLSDTAVFSMINRQSGGNDLGQILNVDSIKTSCWKVGCPIWVRVLPGDHAFIIRYSVFYGLGQKSGVASVDIQDMKPRHVYQANFIDNSNSFRVAYEDLGENPKYGITLGLKGYNQSYFPLQF